MSLNEEVKYIQIPHNKTKGTIQKTRQLHKIRRHKWQDNMNLYENQRWNQVLRKGKNFSLVSKNPWLRRFLVNRTNRRRKYWWEITGSRISNQLRHVNTICRRCYCREREASRLNSSLDLWQVPRWSCDETKVVCWEIRYRLNLTEIRYRLNLTDLFPPYKQYSCICNWGNEELITVVNKHGCKGAHINSSPRNYKSAY